METPDQSHDKEESSILASRNSPGSSADEKYNGLQIRWRPGREKFNERKWNNEKDVTLSKELSEENPSSNVCEHKIKLLENSPKWRNIQKTLHWMDHFLFSNNSKVQGCHKRQNVKRKSNYEIHSSKKKDKKLKNFFEKENPKSEINLTKSFKERTYSRRYKKFKRERKYKLRSWGNRLRSEKNRKKKPKSKWKESRNDSHHFSKKAKFPSRFNETLLKPNSVEKIFCKRTNKSHKRRNTTMTVSVNCEKVKSLVGPENPTGGWSRGGGGREEEEANRKSDKGKQKAKAWPHFVYHRVSSNFLHPDSTGSGHRQSAYVAISVATSNKPESTGDTT